MKKLPAKQAKCGNLVTAVLLRHKNDNLVDRVALEAGTYFGLYEKFTGKSKPLKNIRIPEKAFVACKAAFNLTRRVEYIDVLNAAIALVKKVEPDSQELIILTNEKEAIMAKVDENTKSPVDEFKELFEKWLLNPDTHPTALIGLHAKLKGEDLKDVDWFLDSHENIKAAGIYERAYRRFLRDTHLEAAIPEQRKEILENGWGSKFVKWATVLVTVAPLTVLAIWKWIMSMRKQWADADGAKQKAIMIARNAAGWELAKQVYDGVIGCHIHTDVVGYTPLKALKTFWNY